MRQLDANEEQQLAVLIDKADSFALLEITKTGLDKAIMDATAPLREMLKKHAIHDYAEQEQGQDNKVILPAYLYTPEGSKPTKASLYRPDTKQGDPRIWFYGLKRFADPSDILAVIGHNSQLHLINITRINVKDLSHQQGHAIERLFQAIGLSAGSVASELLGKLKAIAARGLVPSVFLERADTAIGRTLENLLGIQMNSSKNPDYKGIEIKAARVTKRPNRLQLFSQVPDWKISKFKSSTEILNAFGYWSGESFQLNCTVSATSANPQGLRFNIDQDADYLHENSNDIQYGDFVTWRFQHLRERLLKKHAETFWVKAASKEIGGREHFQFQSVVHTRAPNLSQFGLLVEQGHVTMDHQCKRLKNGRAHERGPSFKLKPSSVDLLFPPPKQYNLMEP